MNDKGRIGGPQGDGFPARKNAGRKRVAHSLKQPSSTKRALHTAEPKILSEAELPKQITAIRASELIPPVSFS